MLGDIHIAVRSTATQKQVEKVIQSVVGNSIPFSLLIRDQILSINLPTLELAKQNELRTKLQSFRRPIYETIVPVRGIPSARIIMEGVIDESPIEMEKQGDTLWLGCDDRHILGKVVDEFCYQTGLYGHNPPN